MVANVPFYLQRKYTTSEGYNIATGTKKEVIKHRTYRNPETKEDTERKWKERLAARRASGRSSSYRGTVSGTPFWVWGTYDPSKEQKKHYYDYPSQEEMFFHHRDPTGKTWVTKKYTCPGTIYGWSTWADAKVKPFTEEAFAITPLPTAEDWNIRKKFGLGEYAHKPPCTKKEAELLEKENEQFWTGGWGSAPEVSGGIPGFGIAGLGGGVEAGLGGGSGISKLGVGATGIAEGMFGGTTDGILPSYHPWYAKETAIRNIGGAYWPSILAGLNTATFGIPGKLRESLLGEEYRIPVWTPTGTQYGIFFPGVSTGIEAGIGAGATGAMAGISAGTKKDEISGLGTTGIISGIGAGVQTPWWHEEEAGWGPRLPGWPGWPDVTLPGLPDITIPGLPDIGLPEIGWPEIEWPWGGNGGGGDGPGEDGMSLWTKLGLGLLALGAIYVLAKSAPELAKARKISKTKKKKG